MLTLFLALALVRVSDVAGVVVDVGVDAGLVFAPMICDSASCLNNGFQRKSSEVLFGAIDAAVTFARVDQAPVS
eukprot:7734754-Lingulodinium_polyedra.AAC.1